MKPLSTRDAHASWMRTCGGSSTPYSVNRGHELQRSCHGDWSDGSLDTVILGKTPKGDDLDKTANMEVDSKWNYHDGTCQTKVKDIDGKPNLSYQIKNGKVIVTNRASEGLSKIEIDFPKSNPNKETVRQEWGAPIETIAVIKRGDSTFLKVNDAKFKSTPDGLKRCKERSGSEERTLPPRGGYIPGWGYVVPGALASGHGTFG